MFTSYPIKLYTSNIKYKKYIEKLLGTDDTYHYLNELCSKCGYPRGHHYSRSNNSSMCPTKEDIEKYRYGEFENPNLIPEFYKSFTLIKIL